MPIPDVFASLTEVCIAIIGFAGVVAALGKSQLPINVRSTRIKALLFASSVGLVGSLLPAFLTQFPIPLWQTSAGLLALCIWFNAVWARKEISKLHRTGYTSPVVYWFFNIGTGLMIISLAFAAYLDSASIIGIYLMGIGWQVLLAMNHFFRLIIAVQIFES
jgi:hypothetical protein